MKRFLTALFASSLLFCACSEKDNSSETSNEDYTTYWGGYVSSANTSLFVNGHDCKKNSECISNNCYKNTVCRAPNWDDAKVQGADDGGNCMTNKGCRSGLCVNSICVSSTSVDINVTNPSIGNTPAQSTPSDGKSNGESCSASNECDSGLCSNGKCSGNCTLLGCDQPYHVCRHNKCIPTETIGNECTNPSDCAIGQSCCNGYCVSGKCEAGISCYDYQCDNCLKNLGNCPNWSKDYQDHCRDYGGLFQSSYSTHSSNCTNSCLINTHWGNICSCNSDSECGQGFFCDKGLCVEKKAYNQPCNKDSECKSDNCDVMREHVCKW